MSRLTSDPLVAAELTVIDHQEADAASLVCRSWLKTQPFVDVLVPLTDRMKVTPAGLVYVVPCPRCGRSSCGCDNRA